MALADSLVQYVFKLRTWIARGDVVLRPLSVDLRWFASRFPELKEPVRRAIRAWTFCVPSPISRFCLSMKRPVSVWLKG